MIAPTPRSARLRPLVLLALAVTATVAVVSATACGALSPDPASHTRPPAWGDPTATAPSSPTPTPEPTEPPVSPELLAYLAKVPRFGPAPRPQPVWLDHADGQAAFVHQIPTDKRVAFLTIDDGATRHPMALDLIRAARVPVTLFLTTNYVSGHTDYFKALQDTGHVQIQNHTVSHPNLPQAGYDEARNQLCTASGRLEQWFGQRPIYFRPPYGENDATTLAAAWSCGLRVGFHWRETVDAGNVYYQRDQGNIHPGDIILMHFRPAFPDDFIAALTAIKNSGLTPALLSDWVRVKGVDQPESSSAPPQGLVQHDIPPATEPDRSPPQA